MSKQYTTAEVAQHKDEASGMWLIVDTGVYDVTSTCHLRLPSPGALLAPFAFLSLTTPSQTSSTSTPAAPRS